MWSSLRNENPVQTAKGIGFWVGLLATLAVIWLSSPIWVPPGVAQIPEPIAQPEQAGAFSSELPPMIPATPDAHEAGMNLVHIALRQAIWGEGMTCKIRQRTTLFDKQLVSYGGYAHAGQGTGQLKMHVRLATEKRINTLLEVSDGRVMYSTQHIGETVQRSRVDLNRIREYLGPITTASLSDPVIAMYLAVGGQAELLRKLAQQYRWTHVQAGQLGDVDVWLLTGELATEPPPLRAFAEIDQLLFQPSIAKLLPTKVQIAIGKGKPFPYWLYQVGQAREVCLEGTKSTTRLSMFLEFTEPALLRNASPELFQSDASEETIVEETRRYLPPTPIAVAPSSSQLR